MSKTDPNTCTHCPHRVIDIGKGTLFCPCEDCHVGGLVQGREPSKLGTQAQPTPSTEGDFTQNPLH